ncbi:Jag N-terminal domain-containing protein [Sulfurimonas sp.]
MIKIEAITLEQAFSDAAAALECSVTELAIEVVQAPSSGFLGFFKKQAIIVATLKPKEKKETSPVLKTAKKAKKKVKKTEDEILTTHKVLNDTIMPTSFVSDQDEDDDDLASGLDYTADYDDEYDEAVNESVTNINIAAVAKEVDEKINELFKFTCFDIAKIDVSAYDAETLLIEFKGEDAALLIGKEGYRYKALSYMIFNWINSKYEVQLRLEIAEFLKNQEESVNRYLASVYENIDRDGRAQTKILDGVLVQIALKELRQKYAHKYVAVRTTRDGLKYIIINDYHN